jgi:hypothetical protein
MADEDVIIAALLLDEDLSYPIIEPEDFVDGQD